MVSAVIMIGAIRSLAPRMTNAGPNSMPSTVSRCWKWLIIMMPFRATIPSTVKKPTIDPIEITPPAMSLPTTPPISASGSVRKVNTARRNFFSTGEQDQEDPDRRDDRVAEETAGRLLALGVLADHLRPGPERELDRS